MSIYIMKPLSSSSWQWRKTSILIILPLAHRFDDHHLSSILATTDTKELYSMTIKERQDLQLAQFCADWSHLHVEVVGRLQMKIFAQRY